MKNNANTRIEELIPLVDELVPFSDTPPGQALIALLCAIATLYVRVTRKPDTMSSSDRQLIRTTAQRAIASGITGTTLTEEIRKLTGEAVRRAPKSPALVDASYVVLADCIAAAEPSRFTRVRRMLHDDARGTADQALAKTYTIAVFRIEEHRRPVIIGALAELDGRPIDRHEVIAGPYENNAVILVPESDGMRHARSLLDDIEAAAGEPLCVTTAEAGLDTLLDGYAEAATLLELALAAERAPRLYRIDDLLLEYAAMRDPTVSARMMNIVRPLLGSDRLYETLKAFVQCGYNRGRTARELFVHRTTVDYRIKRIEAITGYNPAAGRGSEVLATAVTLFSLHNTV